MLLALVQLLGDRLVDEIGDAGHEIHQEAHGEDPDDQAGLDVDVGNGQGDEDDEGDAGHAVGLEAVGGGSDRVAGVVAGAVGDDAGVARVVLLDLEDDLHEVGADVGDLGEDAARDAKGRGAERFADGEAEEAVADDLARHGQEDEDHHDQFERDQEQADRHAGPQRDVDHVPRFAAEGGESGTGVGVGVDADAVPGHGVGAAHADDREEQDQNQGEVEVHALGLVRDVVLLSRRETRRQRGDEGRPVLEFLVFHIGEVVRGHALRLQRLDRLVRQLVFRLGPAAKNVGADGDGDEDEEHEQELALLNEVRLAGLENGLGHGQHGLVGRLLFDLGELIETNAQRAANYDGAAQEEPARPDAAEVAEGAVLPKVGNGQAGFTGVGHRRECQEEQQDAEETEDRFQGLHARLLLDGECRTTRSGGDGDKDRTAARGSLPIG